MQRKIYAAELELMDHFPTFSYDFNVIFCTDADWSTLLPSEAEIIYQSTRHADSATALGSSTAQ
uniref:Hypothetical conserved protein n=1 Tax=uncultured Acetothermia bacterium TaxID=236499 RepID=H5SN00_9BACT|nr:hypothetical conserved protein [uncultured Acetothermia bacterium]